MTANEPIARDATAWQSVVRRLEKQYAIADGLLSPFNRIFERIDSEITYTKSDSSYRYQDVEFLLDSSRLLLGRCSVHQREWQQLGERAFALALELFEYYRCDLIHEEEVAAGFYSLPMKLALATLKSELATEKATSESVEQLMDKLDRLFGEIAQKEQVENAQRFGYTRGTPEQKEHWGKAMEQRAHFEEVAKVETEHAMENGQVTARSQLASAKGIKEAASARALGALEKYEWEKADAEFRRRRTKVARDLADLKANAAATEEGILNYRGLMEPVLLRFQTDLSNAITMLHAAVPGMETTFDYTNDFKLPQSGERIPRGFLDEAIRWTNEASLFLSAQTRGEQRYKHRISVRQCAESGWDEGLADGGWVVNVASTEFDGQSHVRLRGVSISVDDGNGALSTWALQVTPPTKTTVMYGGGRQRPITQPRITLSSRRVVRRSLQHDPDTVGILAAHNLCPVGSWEIEVRPVSAEGTDRSVISDVFLDLHLAARSD